MPRQNALQSNHELFGKMPRRSRTRPARRAAHGAARRRRLRHGASRPHPRGDRRWRLWCCVHGAASLDDLCPPLLLSRSNATETSGRISESILGSTGPRRPSGPPSGVVARVAALVVGRGGVAGARAAALPPGGRRGSARRRRATPRRPRARHQQLAKRRAGARRSARRRGRNGGEHGSAAVVELKMFPMLVILFIKNVVIPTTCACRHDG